jgi:predicted ATPase
MHIKKITLHRFKQFRDAEIDIDQGLSLVVGGNNSGKSSILQALAMWQFCKTMLEIEKGRSSWLQTKTKTGLGMGIADFTPMQIPSLSHLWTNLKTNKDKEPDGYTLKVGVYWDLLDGQERHLEIGLSQANDRLFMRTTSTNLLATEIVDAKGNAVDGNVPRVGYLPPFAGITDREARLTPAMRERLIGQGLSGGVIRNVLFDLYEHNKKERDRLRGNGMKLKSSSLKWLRANDPWEILQKTMHSIFATDLRVVPFNERFHSYIRIESAKGELKGDKFTRHPKYTPRDLMVEGSGFLQWLSVYALALSPDVDVVLLDEPDAHLNAMLQKELLMSLANVANVRNKQVLMATHSPELIRFYDHDKILAVADRKAKYLQEDVGKVKVLGGIGTIHTPTLHLLMEHKRMLILEAESDWRFLQLIAKQANFDWPKSIVPWYWTGAAGERLQLYRQLLSEIPGLKAISIRDRDDEPDATVEANLLDKSHVSKEAHFTVMKWRRRHIENYLLCVGAIARAAGCPKEDVVAFFAKHALVVPEDPTATDVALAIRDAHGKEIFISGDSVAKNFNVTRYDVAKSLVQNEIPADMQTFFAALADLAKN